MQVVQRTGSHPTIARCFKKMVLKLAKPNLQANYESGSPKMWKLSLTQQIMNRQNENRPRTDVYKIMVIFFKMYVAKCGFTVYDVSLSEPDMMDNCIVMPCIQNGMLIYQTLKHFARVFNLLFSSAVPSLIHCIITFFRNQRHV